MKKREIDNPLYTYNSASHTYSFNKKKKTKRARPLTILILLLVFIAITIKLIGLSNLIANELDIDSLPKYSGSPYIEVNDNLPFFTDKEKRCTKDFEQYSELDSLGRCGIAYANLSENMMPDGERKSISNIHPTGWMNKE